jgi:hypothetical protein
MRLLFRPPGDATVKYCKLALEAKYSHPLLGMRSFYQEPFSKKRDIDFYMASRADFVQKEAQRILNSREYEWYKGTVILKPPPIRHYYTCSKRLCGHCLSSYPGLNLFKNEVIFLLGANVLSRQY